MNIANPLTPKGYNEYRLAERIRELRAMRGLTQKEVGEIAGIDGSSVRSYELARRIPAPEHVRGLAAALEVMPEALVILAPDMDENEELRAFCELAESYGFEFGYDDDCAYISPVSDFFVEAIRRWARAYGDMCANEESFREDYELWKDEFHEHFNKADFPAIYPDYDPVKPTSEQNWLTERFSAALKDARKRSGMSQAELSDASGINMFTIRSYEQGQRLPRRKHLSALCDALGLTDAGLSRYYFGSPNQAMHHLFNLAKSANLTPEYSDDEGARLRTNGNDFEWAFVCIADELGKMSDDATPSEKADFDYWLSKYDMYDHDTGQDAVKAGRACNNALTKLPPKA